ncbi:MAG: aminopeptidase, partial [Coprobacillus sp.]|nr:aminopeptidase [Coprobacillus sp.]
LGNLPLKENEKSSSKAYILKLLKDKYGIEEEDLISSELEIVPSGAARDYGLDRSMILGYGHDDRSCAYSSLQAILDTENTEYTACCVLVDKEEIGSVGATGAESHFFEDTVIRLLSILGSKDTLSDLRSTYSHTKMISSDVSAGYDPLYAGVSEKDNAAQLGYGLVFNKYLGSGGKSGSNDANPEYYAWIRKTMDENNVNWQSSEIGKVDQGGGGTIAYIFGNQNLDVIDAGIPVLNMHAPMEVVSKVDVYEAYLGYKAFLTK